LIQRFFLGLSSGIGKAGQYRFASVSRSYPGIGADQLGEDYSAIVIGDIAVTFVH